MYINTRTHTRKFGFLQTRFQTRKKRKPPFLGLSLIQGLGLVSHTLTNTRSHSVCVGFGLGDFFYYTHERNVLCIQTLFIFKRKRKKENPLFSEGSTGSSVEGLGLRT